ncbi:MAG: acyl-CoA dehydrogenase family protein [Thermodesulfobacteriota bacterium]
MLNIVLQDKDKQTNMLEKAAREFARKQLAPNREQQDKYPFAPFFDSVLGKAFDLDFFSILLPEDLDGMGMDIRDFSLVLENICQEDSSLGGIMFTNSAAQQIMLQSEGKKLLQKLSSAENVYDFLIAFPSFVSPREVNILPEAKKENGKYRISGSLEYVVLGNLAGYGLIPAKIRDQANCSYFLVDLSDQGVLKSEPVLSLGLRSCPAVDMGFHEASAELAGEEGRGEQYFNRMADRLNVAAAAMSLGIMKGSFREAFDYSKERLQGGQEIIKWSEVKGMISNMAIAVQNADMSLSMAASMVDAQEPGWEQCTRAAALEIQRTACDVTSDGIQVLGGVGYMKDFGQEKRFRDAKQIQSLLGMAPAKRINYLESYIKPKS